MTKGTVGKRDIKIYFDQPARREYVFSQEYLVGVIKTLEKRLAGYSGTIPHEGLIENEINKLTKERDQARKERNQAEDRLAGIPNSSKFLEYEEKVELSSREDNRNKDLQNFLREALQILKDKIEAGEDKFTLEESLKLATIPILDFIYLNEGLIATNATEFWREFTRDLDNETDKELATDLLSDLEEELEKKVIELDSMTTRHQQIINKIKSLYPAFGRKTITIQFKELKVFDEDDGGGVVSLILDYGFKADGTNKIDIPFNLRHTPTSIDIAADEDDKYEEIKKLLNDAVGLDIKITIEKAEDLEDGWHDDDSSYQINSEDCTIKVIEPTKLWESEAKVVLSTTRKEPEYLADPALDNEISSLGTTIETDFASVNYLPRGSALLSTSGDKLSGEGIKGIIHAAPGTQAKPSTIKSLILSIKNSIFLAEKAEAEKIAIPLVGGEIFLNHFFASSDTRSKELKRRELAEMIIISAVTQRKTNLKIAFIDFKDEAFQKALEKINSVGEIDLSNVEPLVGTVENKGITSFDFHESDYIVNAANSQVQFGGGLSGKIAEVVGVEDASVIDRNARQAIKAYWEAQKKVSERTLEETEDKPIWEVRKEWWEKKIQDRIDEYSSKIDDLVNKFNIFAVGHWHGEEKTWTGYFNDIDRKGDNSDHGVDGVGSCTVYAFTEFITAYYLGDDRIEGATLNKEELKSYIKKYRTQNDLNVYHNSSEKLAGQEIYVYEGDITTPDWGTFLEEINGWFTTNIRPLTQEMETILASRGFEEPTASEKVRIEKLSLQGWELVDEKGQEYKSKYTDPILDLELSTPADVDVFEDQHPNKRDHSEGDELVSHRGIRKAEGASTRFKEWNVLQTIGDGNCFLNAFSTLFSGRIDDTTWSLPLRAKLCLELMTNHSLLADHDDIGKNLRELEDKLTKAKSGGKNRMASGKEPYEHLAADDISYMVHILKRPIIMIQTNQKMMMGDTDLFAKLGGVVASSYGFLEDNINVIYKEPLVLAHTGTNHFEAMYKPKNHKGGYIEFTTQRDGIQWNDDERSITFSFRPITLEKFGFSKDNDEWLDNEGFKSNARRQLVVYYEERDKGYEKFLIAKDILTEGGTGLARDIRKGAKKFVFEIDCSGSEFGDENIRNTTRGIRLNGEETQIYISWDTYANFEFKNV